MSWTLRKVALLAGAAAIGVSSLVGTGTATGSTGSAQAAPTLAALTPAQVKARESGNSESMIVVFDDQLKNLPANAADRSARAAAAASVQAPLVSQLQQVGAIADQAKHAP